MRAEQLELQRRLRQAAGKIAHLQKFIDRFKAKASKAKQAQSRVKALERMEKIAPVLAAAEFTFEFRSRQPAQPDAGDADACGYRRRRGRQRPPIVRGINRSVLAGQRIGILGANGQGKSTWSRPSPAPPGAGRHVTEGKGLNIGYFAQQELDVLRPTTARWST
jgi:ATP-binding cassette subfamily F protein 3